MGVDLLVIARELLRIFTEFVSLIIAWRGSGGKLVIKVRLGLAFCGGVR